MQNIQGQLRIAHVASGEMVIPAGSLNASLMAELKETLGDDLSPYTVGSGSEAINPTSGVIAFRYRRTSYGRSSYASRTRSRYSSSRYTSGRSRSRSASSRRYSSSRSRSRSVSSSRYSSSWSRSRSASSRRYSASRSRSRSVSSSRYGSSRSRSRSASSRRYSSQSRGRSLYKPSSPVRSMSSRRPLARSGSINRNPNRSGNPFVSNAPRLTNRRRGPRNAQPTSSWASTNRNAIIGFGLDSVEAGANAWGQINAVNTLSRGNGRNLRGRVINEIWSSRSAESALRRTPYGARAESTRFLQTGANVAGAAKRFGRNIFAPAVVLEKTYGTWDRTGSGSQTAATFATESLDAGVGILSSVGAGALGGAAFGPWGALGGAIAGGLTYLLGQSTKPYQDFKNFINSSLNDAFSNAFSSGRSTMPQGFNASSSGLIAPGGSLAYLDYSGLSSRAATQGLSISGPSQPGLSLSWTGQ